MDENPGRMKKEGDTSMDENMETAAEPENPVNEKEQAITIEGVATDNVQSGPVFIERSLVGQVQAQGKAEVQRSLAGAVVAGADAAIHESAAPVVVAGGNVELTSAYNEVLVAGGTVHAERSFIGMIIADQVTLGEGSRVLLNTPQAVAFGLAAGVAMAVSFMAKRRRRR
jgi:hypothetical protein